MSTSPEPASDGAAEKTLRVQQLFVQGQAGLRAFVRLSFL